MKKNIECKHNCKNVCGVLLNVLELETELEKIYSQSLLECNEPETKKFFSTLKTSRSEIIEQLTSKVNELRARGEIDDEINSILS